MNEWILNECLKERTEWMNEWKKQKMNGMEREW